MEEISQSSAPPLDSLKLSHKITEVAAGEAHTLALTADRSVYSWGTRMFGRLGTGSEFDQMFPVRVEFGSAAVKIVSIAAGAYHSIALADKGMFVITILKSLTDTWMTNLVQMEKMC
ncbi:unnamed protein product [Cuscuta europaea]|uniref:Uncharacterized protein n=1 Tax=Cuscuta europaea TaxID=41803 RepID=A0A9P1EGE7_CUSEU|nr:unnamed protein product [Cuscuta europaea]